jgi:hypothetical protein
MFMILYFLVLFLYKEEQVSKKSRSSKTINIFPQKSRNGNLIFNIAFRAIKLKEVYLDKFLSNASKKYIMIRSNMYLGTFYNRLVLCQSVFNEFVYFKGSFISKIGYTIGAFSNLTLAIIILSDIGKEILQQK